MPPMRDMRPRSFAMPSDIAEATDRFMPGESVAETISCEAEISSMERFWYPAMAKK